MLKNLISFKSHFTLEEKTFNIKKDVMFIWNKYMKGFKKEIDDGNLPPQNVIDAAFQGKGATRWEFSSSEFTSKDAKLAHKINPITIKIGLFPSPAYQPPSKSIHLTFNMYVLRVLKQQAQDAIPDDQQQRFKSEMGKDKIIGTISHELSHWISDTLHNKHISKLIDVAMELNSNEILKLGKKDVNMTYFEIDAQVHAVKAIKQNHTKKQWDALTIDDLFIAYPSLHNTGTTLKAYGKDILNIWLKLLMKRLAREKLLGKKMKRFPKL